MPRRREFYDPFIQQPEAPPPEPVEMVMRGINVEEAGVYVHLGDALDQLRAYRDMLQADGKESAAEAVQGIIASWAETT